MREIKFRFYMPSEAMEGKQATLPELHSAYEGQGLNELIWSLQDLDIILMQFTGLKDKNGKEIYEGDIVDCLPTGGLCVVEWDDDEAGLQMIQKDTDGNEWGYHFEVFENQMIEVRGNIHENPELLSNTLDTEKP